MTAQIVHLAAFRSAKSGGRVVPRSPARQPHAAETSAASNRSTQRQPDERNEARYRLDGQCTLSLWLSGEPARLENISRTGLMAAAAVPHGPGSHLPVSLAGGRDVLARVIWKRDGMVGLELPAGSIGLTS